MNVKLENKHSAIVFDIFKNNILFYNFTEHYDHFTSPKDYETHWKLTMGASNPTNKYFKEAKDHVEAEMSRFTGKVNFDKNEGETASTMSGLTRKSNVKEKAN